MTEVMNQYQPDRVSPPGDTLLESIEALGMSQAELAERLGRPKKTVNEIIQGKAQITPETALQLENVLGVPAAFWMNREARYREFLAREQQDQDLAEAPNWTKRFPLRAMIKAGWIGERESPAERTRELLSFFGVASTKTWEETWKRQEVAFRRSLKHKGDRYAIAAWLRRGEIEGHAVSCAPYDATSFEDAIAKARSLTLEPPDTFPNKLTTLFAATGVAMAWVQEIPKAPISGATRWLNPEKALIQVSLRYKSHDQLWFSIFHEAAHVLKHRKGVFIEDGAQDSDEEREANEFAASTLIPPEAMEKFLTKGNLAGTSIQAFARSIGIDPGIVVGRLRHDGLLNYTQCSGLVRGLRWSEAARA